MVVSEHDVDKVDLVPDEEEICNINTDGFNAANVRSPVHTSTSTVFPLNRLASHRVTKVCPTLACRRSGSCTRTWRCGACWSSRASTQWPKTTRWCA